MEGVRTRRVGGCVDGRMREGGVRGAPQGPRATPCGKHREALDQRSADCMRRPSYRQTQGRPVQGRRVDAVTYKWPW